MVRIGICSLKRQILYPRKRVERFLGVQGHLEDLCGALKRCFSETQITNFVSNL